MIKGRVDKLGTSMGRDWQMCERGERMRGGA